VVIENLVFIVFNVLAEQVKSYSDQENSDDKTSQYAPSSDHYFPAPNNLGVLFVGV
jgi:hypothetical protein